MTCIRKLLEVHGHTVLELSGVPHDLLALLVLAENDLLAPVQDPGHVLGLSPEGFSRRRVAYLPVDGSSRVTNLQQQQLPLTPCLIPGLDEPLFLEQAKTSEPAVTSLRGSKHPGTESSCMIRVDYN